MSRCFTLVIKELNMTTPVDYTQYHAFFSFLNSRVDFTSQHNCQEVPYIINTNLPDGCAYFW